MKNKTIIKVYKFILDVIVEIVNIFINVAGIVSLITVILLGNVYEWDFQKIFYDLSLLKNVELREIFLLLFFSTLFILGFIKVILKTLKEF
ncbi:hypothetical protein [Arcobacter sp. L]|uniref:hypothetical protein n=1 Tax=Arcobacter sp. L TaxID=944547 RepID=UPI000229644C|nr:hypothetical protein [Arcobacter sp. L]BAK73158.1 hypothetical protein ABLL_1283 [Arcobacter sp. L]